MSMNGNGAWTGHGHFDGYVPEGGQPFFFGQGQLERGGQAPNQENYPGNAFRGNSLTTALNSYNFVFVQPGDYQVNVGFSNRVRNTQPQSILPHGQSDQTQGSSRQSSNHCPVHGESGYDVCGRMPFGENNDFNPVQEAVRLPEVIRTPSTDRFHSCENVASATGGARGSAGFKSLNHSVSEQDSGYSTTPRANN